MENNKITLRDEFSDIETSLVMELIGELDIRTGLGHEIMLYLFNRLTNMNHEMFQS